MKTETKADISKREIIVDLVSKKNNSLQSEDGVWYNINPTLSEDFKKDAVEMINKLGKGDKVELAADFQKRLFNVIVLKKKAEREEFTNNKDMLNLKSLLAAAHKQKFKGFRTEILKIDLEKKYALAKCIAKDKNDAIFEAHGDTTKENLKNSTDKIKEAYIRMAETRAICRALRFLTNNAEVAQEETDEGKDSIIEE